MKLKSLLHRLFNSMLCVGLLGAFSVNSHAQAPTLSPGAKFEHVMDIGAKGTGDGQFNYVEDFAFDSNGNLLATDAVNATVQVFNPKTGGFIGKFGGKGDEDHQLEKPEGIAVDPDGNIFVADYNTGYVKKYDKNHKWLLTFSDFGKAPGELQSFDGDIRLLTW